MSKFFGVKGSIAVLLLSLAFLAGCSVLQPTNKVEISSGIWSQGITAPDQGSSNDWTEITIFDDGLHFPMYLRQVEPRKILAWGQMIKDHCSESFGEAWGNDKPVDRQVGRIVNGGCLYDFSGSDPLANLVWFSVDDYPAYPCKYVLNDAGGGCHQGYRTEGGNLRYYVHYVGNEKRIDNVEILPMSSPSTNPGNGATQAGSGNFQTYSPSMAGWKFNGSWSGSTVRLMDAASVCSRIILNQGSFERSQSLVELRGTVSGTGNDCIFSILSVSEREAIAFSISGSSYWNLFRSASGRTCLIQNGNWLKLGC